MTEEPPKNTKTELALAIAQGVSVAAWARHHGVPRRTAFDWAKDPTVRKDVEAYRRCFIDQAVGRMSKKSTWIFDEIARIAENAESDSVRLRALRSLVTDVMAASKYWGLEFRMTGIEERLDARDRQMGRPG